jgi:alginate O-acetyltransferase complex protein AlgI
MLFPTVEYALFFFSVLGIAWILYRWPIAHKSFLLVASYLFYGFWNWSFVPLLAVISLFAALVARKIQASEAVQQRKKWLAIGIVACLAVLAYYKYTRHLC